MGSEIERELTSLSVEGPTHTQLELELKDT